MIGVGIDSSYRRARGRLVVGARRAVGEPLRRRFPLDAYRWYHRGRRSLCLGRYTDADPFAVVRVDPDRIDASVLESAPGVPQWGQVVGGDWDRDTEPFDRRPVPRAIVQRFEAGLEWSETALVDAFDEQLDRFGTAWGYTDRSDLDRRCAEVDRLHEAIAERGYRRQSALGARGRRDAAVPVLLHRRHAGWQAGRDAIRSGEAAPEAHPDLRDLLPSDDGV